MPPLGSLRRLGLLSNTILPLALAIGIGGVIVWLFADGFSFHRGGADARSTHRTKRTSDMKTTFATFGAGCCWGVEQKFREIPGVVETAVGYMGGQTTNPSYKDVCTDTTGHAEVVQVEFDPTKVTYEQLLDAFWRLHDPTQVNRQGPDFGKQYRSVVFVHSPEQQAAAQAAKDQLSASGRFRKPIATQIVSLPPTDFWRAEEYHQQYLEKRGLGSCHL